LLDISSDFQWTNICSEFLWCFSMSEYDRLTLNLKIRSQDMQRLIVISILLITCMTCGFVQAGDWPCWRGPNGNGVIDDNDWNPAALKGIPKVLWEINVGMGHSTAVVRGNFLYTMGNRMNIVGKDTVHTDIVYCIDTKTGRTIWDYTFPCKDGQDPGPGSTPVLDGSSLYTISREGHLFCFNAESGSVVWKRHIVAEKLTNEHNWGFSCSPVIDENVLILNVNKSGMGLEKKTGKVIWNSEKGEGGFATPVFYTRNNIRMAVLPGMDSLCGVEVKSGKVKWTLERESRCADPIIVDDKMLITGSQSALFELTDNEPKMIWENKRALASFQSWVVVNGFAYGFATVRRVEPLRCLDMKTGEVKWDKEFGEMGALIAAGGKLIVINRGGNLSIVDTNPEEFNEISQAQIVTMASNRGVPGRRQCHCWTAPVLTNERIYARNTWGNLVCVDVSL